MTQLIKIIKEQKKVLLFLTLAITLVPFVFVAIWGPGIKEAPFGVYNGDGSALSENIVQMIDSTPELNITYYTASEEELAEAVRMKTVAAGIIIPENFSADMGKKLCPTVIVLANGTDLILGGSAMGAAAKVVGTLNAGIQIKTLQGAGLMPHTATTTMGTFNFVERLMYEPTGGFIPKMMYTIPVIVTLVLYIEEFFMPFMIQERKKMISCQKDDLKDILCHSILSVAVVSVWIIILSYVALLSMYFTAGLPMRGNLLLYFISMIACTLNMVAFSTMCFAIVRKEKYFALFIQIFCTVTSTHVIMGGINYPFYMMPEWVKMLSNLIYPLTPMLEGLKALNLKGVGWEQMLPYLLNSLRYTIMWMAAAIFILKKDLTNSREKYHNGRSEEYLEGRSETECDQQMNC